MNFHESVNHITLKFKSKQIQGQFEKEKMKDLKAKQLFYYAYMFCS